MRWDDPERNDGLCEKAITILEDIMDGKTRSDQQRKAAQFIAANRAWCVNGNTTVHINLITENHLRAALEKAGLRALPQGRTVNPLPTSDE